jgi:Tfp pilus assembly protein PilX
MKGAFFVVILIAMLIVGILTMKDMNTETVDGVERSKATEKAEDAAKQAEEATDRIKESLKNIDIPSLE